MLKPPDFEAHYSPSMELQAVSRFRDCPPYSRSSGHRAGVARVTTPPVPSRAVVGGKLQLALADNAHMTLIGITSLASDDIVWSEAAGIRLDGARDHDRLVMRAASGESASKP